MAEKAKSSGQVHAGHRQRLKDRFLKSGLDHMEPHVVLELLLFYAIPQGDVNPLAHRLLDRFGNLYGVCSAPVEELTQVPGVGPNTAVLLKLLLPLCRELLRQQNETGDRVVDAQTAYQMLSPLFLGRKEEAVGLLLLDSRGRKLYCGIVREGSVRTAPVYVRDLVRLVVAYNADSAILAHNHPSGSPVPSAGDMEATREVYRALDSIDCHMSDPLILGGDEFLSMNGAGLLKAATEDAIFSVHGSSAADGAEFVY